MTNGTGAAARITGRLDINAALGFAFGVVFLSVMLAFAVWYPNPSPFQIRVFVTALALAAAGVGAVLPGRIEVAYKPLLRAGGAIAMFALVFLVQPTLERTVVTVVRPTVSPEPAAQRYLAAVDRGDIQGAWQQFDPVARGSVVTDLNTYQSIYATFRAPLGMMRKRELTGTSFAESPPGAPVGAYAALIYRTEYEKGGCRPEGVTLRATQQLEWLVYSHNIGPSPIPC